MPQRITAEVSTDVLNILFNDLNLWQYIKNGQLKSIKLKSVPARDYPHASSRIILHFLPNGKQIATTHCITDNKTGKVLHWDAKDIIINGICLFRF
jgi:hypothetical protein